ncbi:hypothetical protein B0H63DRAFT_519491 [Podospora didyma]|uniref:Uncharacterized protein n=1 Tax=Podospora didyma TaxID=330526 RepID=A0AAE0U463_9PEZI|nr:hypothetical protein B0H63DRAFT_519491 [Podospora didyma]
MGGVLGASRRSQLGFPAVASIDRTVRRPVTVGRPSCEWTEYPKVTEEGSSRGRYWIGTRISKTRICRSSQTGSPPIGLTVWLALAGALALVVCIPGLDTRPRGGRRDRTRTSSNRAEQ